MYPMLDDRQITPSSQWDAPIWSHDSNRVGWMAYLGERYDRDVPPYAAPARAGDVDALPPAFVLVGGVDGLRDEDIEYAHRLMQAGVPTELHVYPGAPHGFDGIAAGSAVAQGASADMDHWLRRVLGRRGVDATAAART
jgi:acetyl esterase/lipase